MPKLDLIGIITKDIERSIRFYRMLGIDAPDPDEEDHVEAVLPNGLRVAWDKVEMIKGFMPHWEEPKGHRMGLAFLCDGPADVDLKVKEITDAGFEKHLDPWDAFWGQRYAQLRDPDGNVVDLFAPL